MMDVQGDGPQEQGNWWTFYPLCGIEITDARHDLRRPLFGDVTLIAKRHLSKVIGSLQLDEDQPYDAKYLKRMAEDVERMAERDSAQAFLAVRRRGVAFEDNDGEDTPLVHESRERAYEVAALLAVVTLANSRYQQGCGLGEQIHRRPEDLAMFDVEQGGFWMRTSGRHALSWFSATTDEKMSRAMLKRMLFRRPFRSLSEIMLTKRSTLPSSLRKSIKQAALRLADAIHSTTETAQLLGAVIVLELLFNANDGEKYDVIQQRLSAFLGEEDASQFEIEKIFKARHRYMHEGQEVTGERVPYHVVVLALLCLLRYAEAVSGFKDKRDFAEYLDFIYRAERRAAHWDGGRRKGLVLHRQNTFYLPFGPLRKEHGKKLM